MINSICVLISAAVIAFGGYEKDLPNGYSYIEASYSDYEGRIITNRKDGIIMRYVSSLGVAGHILFGIKEIPKRYYPRMEYDAEYFIIDTKASMIITSASENSWRCLLKECGLKTEPKLKCTSDTNPLVFSDTLAKDISGVFQREGHGITPFKDDYAPSPIDINTVSAFALQRLPRLGPMRATRICSERDKNGPYTSIDDLARRVQGITTKDIMLWNGEIAFSKGSLPTPHPVAKANDAAGRVE